jgi:hypothetical protein
MWIDMEETVMISDEEARTFAETADFAVQFISPRDIRLYVPDATLSGAKEELGHFADVDTTFEFLVKHFDFKESDHVDTVTIGLTSFGKKVAG